MNDAGLVADALAGDRHAYAAMYDRYADRIHDFAASLLSTRGDAAEDVREAFGAAFAMLDELAEPDRLGAWLYALAHRAARDRVPDEEAPIDDIDWGSGQPNERLTRAHLAEFVRQVWRALPEPDRALLDLHLRQGLEGDDLARAAGVPAAQLDERLQTLQPEVERSLGALLVARTGRRSCPGLFAVLNDWDGRMTSEFRDRVTGHCDDCERCNSQRRIAPNPLALLAATPAVPAPAYLRRVVLGPPGPGILEPEADVPVGHGAPAHWTFHRDGFPVLGDEPNPRTEVLSPEYVDTGPLSVVPAERTALVAASASGSTTGPPGRGGQPPWVREPAYLPPEEPTAARRRPPDRLGILIGALLGLIILVGASVALLSRRSSTKTSPSGTVGIGVTTTVAATTTTLPALTTPFTARTVAPTVPPTTVVTAGHLIVSSRTLDLGTTASSGSLVVGNDGPSPLDFTAAATGAGLTVTPIASSLAPQASQTLTVALDRSMATPGPFSGSILLQSPSASVNIVVAAVIDAGPAISGETQQPSIVYTGKCPLHVAGPSTITATVSGPLPLRVVVLHWQSTPAGTNGAGSTAMTATGSSVGPNYTGKLGPFATAGTVDWWITAIDSANSTGTSTHHSLSVTC